MSIEAMEQVLEALKGYRRETNDEAIAALRTAIEAAEKQKPVDTERIKGLEDAAYGLLAILERVGDGATVASVLTLLESKTIPPAAQRQHVTDGSPCWCNPETRYTDPETGASVIVHKEPQ